MPSARSSSIAFTPVSATAASLSVSPPPAYLPGDLLIMAAAGGATGTVYPQPPAGWTPLSAAGSALGIFWKTAAAGEPGSTVTFSAACTAAVTVTAYPPATVVSSEFAASGADVVGYAPAFPPGVTAAQTVLLFAATQASLTDPNHGSSSTGLNFPAAWTPEIDPFGPAMFSNPGADAVVSLGLCDIQGAAADPVLTSAVGSDFFAAFVVLELAAPAATLEITATGSGGAYVGMALTVTALTGAAAATDIIASGATASSYLSGAPELAITPAAAGSWVYGAVWEYNPGAAYTPASGTTFSQNINDPANLAGYGTFRSAGPATAGAPVILGGSAPAGNYIDIALAEILAAGPLTEVATAAVSATQAWQYTTMELSQTAIFPVPPPAGALLVATVSANSRYSPATTMAVSGGGLTWTQLAASNGAAYAGVWIAQLPSPAAP